VNDRSGLITLAVYTTATMLIVLVAFLGIFRYGALARVASLENIPSEPEPDLAVARLQRLPGASSAATDEGNFEKQRLRVLEAMLAEKSDLLRRQAQQISRQAADLTEMRRNYENAMLAVESLRSGDEPAESESDAGTTTQESASAADTATGVAQLEAELMLARAVHESLISDLDALEEELAEAYEEIETMRDQSRIESTNHLRDALVVEAASANILMNVGSDAIPALTEALSHADPVVRRWAATVLGGFGREAESATGALTETLSDANADVRRAAKAALDAIER
jgi:hypothetical protein